MTTGGELEKEAVTSLFTLFSWIGHKVYDGSPKRLLKRGDKKFQAGLTLFKDIQDNCDEATLVDFKEWKKAIEDKRKELDEPKQNSIYYLGNHRDLYNDIKLFYKFCLNQSNRWTFEMPAEDSRSRMKQAGAVTSGESTRPDNSAEPATLPTPITSTPAPVDIATPVESAMVNPLTTGLSLLGPSVQDSSGSRDWLTGTDIPISEVHWSGSTSSMSHDALEIKIPVKAQEAFKEFCAIPPNEVPQLPRETLVRLFSSMFPEELGLEQLENWELTAKALAEVERLKIMRDILAIPASDKESTMLIEL